MRIKSLGRNTAKAMVALAIFFSAFAVAARFTPNRPEQTMGHGHWIVVNGHPLYFEIRGSGAPLILLHGGGDTIPTSFSKQLGSFELSHQIIAPEQVGHGHTPDVAAPLTYSEMMEDTANLMQQLGIANADVVGWSDGGIIALMLAVHHPELVRRIVVSGANISPDGLQPSEIEAMRRSSHDATAQRSHLDQKLTTLWLNSPTKDELNTDLLGQVRKPVLVMAGDHDVIRLEHTLKIYNALPQGQLYVLPDTGHGTFEERSAWVNPVVLAFLAHS